jgi:uncharacterized protein YjbI with pentapeptide repeats
VVVTSRTQHFESDQQVKTALYDRTQTLPGLHLARLQAFEDDQILQFLENQLGDHSAAVSRLQLIRDIRDLLGLSANPRMLSFIANLPEEKLREAQSKSGAITSAELYRLLIERWLTFEYDRVQPRGAAPTLSMQERWDAVTAVALALWPRLERTINLTELTDNVAQAVTTLAALQYDAHTAAHAIGSGTLLIRDEAGQFSFVHQSVMEWLVANHARQQLQTDEALGVLGQQDMSPLMADFFCDLVGHPSALQWAVATLGTELSESAFAKANALLVMKRLGVEAESQVSLSGQDLRGKDFTQQQLSKANFAKADLSEARLVEADLAGANFSETRLERANLTRANLRGANLTGSIAAEASFLGTNLQGATLKQTSLRRTKLVGAQVSLDSLAQCDLFGAALPTAFNAEPMLSSASSCNAVVFGPDLVLASGHDDGTVRLWDACTGLPLRTLKGHTGPVVSVAFSPDGTQLASGSDDNTVRLWEVASGTLLATLMATAEGWVAFTPNGRYRLNGNLGGGFWYVVGLCRFEPGEIDPFLPPGTLRQLGFDEPLWNNE